MKIKPTLRSIFLRSAIIAVFPAASVEAATIYFDGGTGNWNTGGLSIWSESSNSTTPNPTALPDGGDDLIFNVTTNNTANNVLSMAGGNRAANSITFNSSGTTNFRSGANGNTTLRTLTIGAGGLTVNSGAGAVTMGQSGFGPLNVALGSDQTWVNDSTNSLTFTGVVTGTGRNLIKGGTGTIVFQGANTYSGTTTISGGTLSLENNLALQNSVLVTTGAGNLSLGAAVITPTFGGLSGVSGDLATVIASGYDAVTDLTLRVASGSQTYAGAIGEGATGMNLIKLGNGTQVLAGSNSYTGTTTINAGALVVENATGLGTSAAGTVVNGTNTSDTNNARLELSGGVTVTGESLTISGTGNFNGALSSTSGNNVWAGDVTIGASGTRIGASAGASLEISGTIDSGASPHGLIIRSTNLTGTVILSGANTYLGSTQVLIGTLQLAGGDNRLPVGTNLTLNSASSNPGAEFDLNGTNQEIAGLALGGSGDALNNSVNNSSLTASTLTVNTGAASPSTYGGILKGNLGLTKEGEGSMTLTGTSNTYTGETRVNQGALIVNGSTDAASAVTVGSGATLGGTGTVGGSVEVTGIIAPGNSIGTLKTGSTTWNGAASAGAATNWQFELAGAGTSSDVLEITGDFTKDTGSGSVFHFDFMGSTPAYNTAFALVTWTGTTNFDADLIGLDDFTYSGLGTGPYNTSFFQITGNTLYFTAIPEPTTALAGLLLGAGLFRRRRK